MLQARIRLNLKHFIRAYCRKLLNHHHLIESLIFTFNALIIVDANFLSKFFIFNLFLNTFVPFKLILDIIKGINYKLLALWVILLIIDVGDGQNHGEVQ